ncbi:phage regulatory CII family protein [Nitrosomonas sp.]|uniref:phage regulatory CII family protein n=1 Tax=Nitrosomonas sp. TaxID=42353 RepID=UPI0025E016F2|nr:phage regulatory CII family protein [Nitrosomonas sp.]
MSINNLIFRIAKKYGITALSEDLGINTNTFKNKVNPNIDTHHVYAHELDLIATIADTDEIAQYFAEERGLMCIKKPNYEGLSDKEILDLFLDVQAKQGDWARSVSKALEHGSINWDELRSIKSDYTKFVVAAAEAMSRLECYMAVTEERKTLRSIRK